MPVEPSARWTPWSLPLSPSPARIRSTIASVVDQPDELRDIRLFHKALADVNRLRIVQRLSSGAASVTELIDHVGLSQPLVSWHLGKLRASGIVATRRSGRETVCSIRPETFSEIAARERALFGRALTVEIPFPSGPAIGEGVAR
jgi:ArsR family transcriptional regulator, arsenate/arsenite/antimonite-responsive transcriptional repressor